MPMRMFEIGNFFLLNSKNETIPKKIERKKEIKKEKLKTSKYQ